MIFDFEDAMQEQVLLQELSEVVEQCQESDCIVTLKRFLQKPDGTLNQMDIQQKVIEGIKCKCYLNKYMTVVISKPHNKAELTSIKSIFQIFMQRVTQNNLKGEPNDYALVIDFVKQELQHNKVYTLSLIDPIFLSMENEDCTLVYEMQDMHFGIEEVTLDEIEYQEEVDKDRMDDIEEQEKFAENDEYTDNEDILNNDKYINE